MDILKRRNPMTLLLLIVFTTLFVMIFVTTNYDNFYSNNLQKYIYFGSKAPAHCLDNGTF